jgi:hypothetical protein
VSREEKNYPATRGLNWHRHQYYSFFVPIEWHRFSWDEEHEGAIFGPDPEDSKTVFAVDFKDLGTPILAEDLPILAEGFFEQVERLPEIVIELRDQRAVGNQIELEAKYTFVEGGQTRKRWVRVHYQDTRQIAITAQGATPEKYDYWLPWFFEAMMTARFHREKPTSPY